MDLKIAIAGLAVLVGSLLGAGAQEWIAVRGVPVAAEAMNLAAGQIKKETGLEFVVATEGGNGSAIVAISDDLVDLALLNRSMSPRERAASPDKTFFESRFGMQALLIVVPEQVWKSGVRALTKEQLRDIYEGNVTNWKTLGGDDRKLVFFNRNVARHQWELLGTFLYDDLRKVPPSPAETLDQPGEVTTTVEFNGGSISVLEFNAPRNGRIHALGIKLPDGTVVEPTVANIASGRYELARPLIMATARKPAGKARRLVDFMLGPVGQEFVRKTGHIPNADLVAEKPPPSESR